MNKLFILIVALALTSCTKYTVKFGKKCTPGNSEWSWIWVMEKDGSVNVAEKNCIKR